MKISVVGTGYVGLVTGACLAEKGHEVACVDVVGEKVEAINRGEAPIYEDGLEELVKKNVGKRLRASTELEPAIAESELTFICVGTPSREDGAMDLKYVKSAARSIGKALADKAGYHVVTVKSTVSPGTTEEVVLPILEKESGKKAGKGFGLAMNPEFLREGRAVEDFMNPDRIVIGALDEKSDSAVKKVYEDLGCPVLSTDPSTAEMIKYASNAFLATKISFINEIANICERLGTDVGDVAEGVGLDARISPDFLNAGLGWGGSCFPKDVKALVNMSEGRGYKPGILKAALEVNESQPLRVLEVLREKRGELKGKKIAMVGLAFKPGTDDIREARSLVLLERLLREGADVSACDPAAVENVREKFGVRVRYCDSLESCVKGADAAVIVTEWPEYMAGPEVFGKSMKGNLIIDGRRVLDPVRAKESGLDYWGVGYGR